MNKALLFLLSSLMLFSCAGTKKAAELKKEMAQGPVKFSYTDKNGTFLVRMSSGFNNKNNSYFTKRSLEIPEKENDNLLETSVTFSELGSVNRKTILRPKVSQYNVWFDGKKYFSELKMNPAKKAMDVRMVSPETQWNGTKQIKLPSTKSNYCFFSQVIDCARATGFLSESSKKEEGTLNFYVVWEGFPYLNETFINVPSQLFSKAQLEYDGVTKDNELRFNLKVAGQSIFYVVDDKMQMKKMFWVSQGISMVSMTSARKKSPSRNSEPEEESDGGGLFE